MQKMKADSLATLVTVLIKMARPDFALKKTCVEMVVRFI